MQSGYYNVVGGMVTQFNKLETITNNLANVNTNGFKQDKDIIGDYIKLFQEKREVMPLNNNTVSGSKFFNRTMDRVPQVSEQYIDFSIGNVKETSNPLDIAITRGQNFFAIKENDELVLSRNGSFTLNEEGYLINKNGGLVLNKSKESIQIEPNVAISISNDGNIYADNKHIDDLFVASAHNIKQLTKYGNGNFKLNNQEIFHNANSGVVAQGYLELSNVNPVYSMTSMIATNRLLEMQQKVASSHMDELNSEAINKIAVNK